MIVYGCTQKVHYKIKKAVVNRVFIETLETYRILASLAVSVTCVTEEPC